jgi:hypothetical protein
MKNINLEKRIKLKTGFFKKESYLLILKDKEIKLKPEEKNNSEEFKIEIPSIKTVTISGKNSQEIEIITEAESFVGNFIDEDDISEIILFLKIIFDSKFNYN